MENEIENSNIKKFFRNTNVLLTGSTGFMGKLLVSKLLVTCEVSRIYLLIRKKSTKTPGERFQELFDDPVFDHLKDKKPRYADSIELIEGDCSLENLGLSRQNEEAICKNVNIVIHAAAAMNFLGSLKTAVRTNVCGTRNLLHLAERMTNLMNFTYVSTMGAHYDLQTIEEKIYDWHINYDDLLNLLKIDAVLPMDDHNEKKILGSKMSIYALTKGAAEQIFIKERLYVPVTIFRCSLVYPCWKEPMSGWTDNFHGINGLIALCLNNGPNAFLLESTSNYSCDGAPADYTINALIAAIPFSSVEYERTKEATELVSPCVINYSNMNRNPLCLEKLALYMKERGLRYPSFCSNKIVFQMLMLFHYYIPAAFADTLTSLMGFKLGFLKYIKVFEYMNTKFHEAASRKVQVIDDNVRKCWKNLNSVDKELYPFDPCLIEWDDYIPIYVRGIQAFLLRTEKYRSLLSLSFLFPTVRYIFLASYIVVVVHCARIVYGLL